MTRLKNKRLKEKQAAQDAARKHGPKKAKKKSKPADIPKILLSENWKQKSMVKKDSSHSALTTMMHLLQIAGSTGIIAFAACEVSFYGFTRMSIYSVSKYLTLIFRAVHMFCQQSVPQGTPLQLSIIASIATCMDSKASLTLR